MYLISFGRLQMISMNFLIAEYVSVIEIHPRMQNVYGTKCMSLRSVFRWCKDFPRGRNSTDDRSRGGRLPLRKTLQYRNIDL